jgi:hypothetical protein
VYDRDGTVIRSLSPELALGADVGARSASIGAWHVPWDGQVYPPVAYLQGSTPGFVERLEPSRVIVRGSVAGEDEVALKVLAVNGDVMAEHRVPGAWEAFRDSPRRGFLYAVRDTDGSGVTHAGVFRVADGVLVWSGDVSGAAFARDDSRFVFTRPSSSQPVGLVDLATGIVRNVRTPFATDPSVVLSVQAALVEHAVIGGRVGSEGRLFSVDWRGGVRAFGDPSPETDATLQRLDAAGTTALWSRATNELHSTMPGAYVGAYATELATGATTPWDGTDFACFGGLDSFPAIVSNALSKCACDTGDCEPIATLPETDWFPRLVVSRDRNALLVAYEWHSARVPTTFPESFAFAANGELLATIPNGTVELDATGQLVLVRSSFGNSEPTTAVNLATGRRFSLDAPVRAAFAYE